ncbi:MAG: hypothetical protein C4586_08535 [Anaerolineaceae bacterium]|nr:MAG: hypothetical protein C4586_08535 [Anaerolineaceae bacterium]
MKLHLFGIVGKAYVGKTTIGDHLTANFDYARVAFADPLKKMLITAGMCTHEECYGAKTERSRWLMQKVGTEIFRKQVDPLYWVNRCEDEICRIMGEEKKHVVVDDVRFPEEAKRIRDLGGVLIKVERIGYTDETAGTTHDSERFVDSIDCDYTIRAESGDVEKLIRCIEEIIGERP